jgi:uncharacterized protein (DUF983 family)
MDFLNNPENFSAIIIILMIWSLIWKGLALWKSARLNQKTWYIIMLLVNTVGILEIIYLLIVRNKEDKKIEKVEVTHE